MELGPQPGQHPPALQIWYNYLCYNLFLNVNEMAGKKRNFDSNEDIIAEMNDNEPTLLFGRRYETGVALDAVYKSMKRLC